MRILHVADRLSDRGGAYRYLAELVATQRARHEVALWVGHISPDVRAPCPVTRVPGLDARARKPVTLPPERHEYDEVHLHNVVNPEALEAFGRLPEPRKRITLQDHRYFCPGRGKLTLDGRVCKDAMESSLCRDCFSDKGYFQEVFALTRERLDALSGFEIEVLSDYMKRELVAVGLPDTRVAVRPPRVALAAGAPSEAMARAVLFVGRLVMAKGVWDAVEAWRRAEVALPLVFVGTGPLRGELERQGFDVLGWVPHDRMPALYESAAAVLMPSRWQEPFGIAGLEAQSLGTPVIAWESGGISEWHRGPRVAWGDVEGMARALRRVVTGPRRAPR